MRRSVERVERCAVWVAICAKGVSWALEDRGSGRTVSQVPVATRILSSPAETEDARVLGYFSEKLEALKGRKGERASWCGGAGRRIVHHRKEVLKLGSDALERSCKVGLARFAAGSWLYGRRGRRRLAVRLVVLVHRSGRSQRSHPRPGGKSPSSDSSCRRARPEAVCTQTAGLLICVSRHARNIFVRALAGVGE